MKITIWGSETEIGAVANRLMVVLNSEFDFDVIMHDEETHRMPHAIEKGYATIYVNRTERRRMKYGR